MFELLSSEWKFSKEATDPRIKATIDLKKRITLQGTDS